MLLRRSYAVALAVTIIVGVALYAVPRVVDSTRAAQARSDLAAARAAVRPLAVPADAVALTAGCSAPLSYRCYRLPAPTAHGARVTLLRMLASVGVREPRELGCASRATAHGQVVDCGYSAVIDHETLLVSLGPHFDCHGERCRLTKDSEITVALGP